MSVEFPTPQADEPTYRVPYEEVPSLEQAVAWIERPPLPQDSLKKLKKGVLLTARVQAEWVKENGHLGEEIAAMGLMLRVGTKNVPPKIALVTRDGISVDGERVGAEALGLVAKKTRDVDVWLGRRSTASELLSACEGIPGPLLALTACAIARAVLHLVPPGEDRPRVAIETTEDWALGKATMRQVQAACDGAMDAFTNAVGAARYIARAARYATETAIMTATKNETTLTAIQIVRATREAWIAVGGLDAVNNTATQRSQIVRSWIVLPEVTFAVITRKK